MMADYKELYLLLLYYFSNIFARLTLISVSLDKSFLLELLSNENDRTKALVATHCLGYGVYVSEAKKVLSSLAKSKANPILAFEAQATLDVWKQQGYLKF